MWLGNIKCALIARLFGTLKMKKGSKKGKLMHSVPVCPCLSETVCAHTFCMWLHCTLFSFCDFVVWLHATVRYIYIIREAMDVLLH